MAKSKIERKLAAILVGWWCARLFRSGERSNRWWRIVVLAVGLIVMSVVAPIPGLGALTLFSAFVLGTGAAVAQAMCMRDAFGSAP